MIKQICIENYKSIQELKIELGRVTVFIGENGCGKTNILEAIALSSAAASDKLDNEFLASRGIRVTEPQFMRSAFNIDNLNKEIKISLQFHPDKIFTFDLQHYSKPYSSWVSSILSNQKIPVQIPSKSTNLMYEDVGELKEIFPYQLILKFLLETDKDILTLKSFLIFSPENTSLRIFSQEGQIQPLGIKGEGLFKLLTVLNLEENQGKLQEIKEKMQLIDWFEDLAIPHNLSPTERITKIKDKYLASELDYFNQNSSNEGFLFLLFYFCLFISYKMENPKQNASRPTSPETLAATSTARTPTPHHPLTTTGAGTSRQAAGQTPQTRSPCQCRKSYYPRRYSHPYLHATWQYTLASGGFLSRRRLGFGGLGCSR